MLFKVVVEETRETSFYVEVDDAIEPIERKKQAEEAAEALAADALEDAMPEREVRQYVHVANGEPGPNDPIWVGGEKGEWTFREIKKDKPKAGKAK